LFETRGKNDSTDVTEEKKMEKMPKVEVAPAEGKLGILTP